jgi:hypothetical protein
MPAGIIKSNLKEARVSWDDEVMQSPEHARLASEVPLGGRSTTATVEEAQRLYEVNVDASKGQKWAGQERWQGKENIEARLVRIMHPHAIFRALQRAGIDARIESPLKDVWITGKDGKPQMIQVAHNTSARLWLNDAVVRGRFHNRIGVNAWTRDDETGERKWKVVTTLQYPCGPEWSVMAFTRYNVPTEEAARGWRTAMLHLIIANVLTEEEVNRAFGPPTLGPSSLLYRQHLAEHRRKRLGVVSQQ